jgi:hypothetical protein
MDVWVEAFNFVFLLTVNVLKFGFIETISQHVVCLESSSYFSPIFIPTNFPWLSSSNLFLRRGLSPWLHQQQRLWSPAHHHQIEEPREVAKPGARRTTSCRVVLASSST